MGLFSNLKNRLIRSGLTHEEHERVARAMTHLNSAGYDPWGVNPETLKASLASSIWLYRKYFRVETKGLENVPQGRLLLVGNHGGQVPIDGMLIATSMLLEANPPRLARGMVERWAPALPFISTWFARCGQITGDYHNCKELLEQDECVMVFPEGVSGSGKTIFNRYELQRFGTGFMRLALETNTPILPVASIGFEEALPSISKLAPLAKKLGAPYLPVIPTGFLPLPTKVTLRFGKPLRFEASPDASDSEIERLVDQVKFAIQTELEEGLRIRGERIFTGVAK
ncbi:MAG: acyltransferase family protein [Proteobacteria bacterium]|nr:MAG: acyltransferase family protein [Pseudomonadota bacterium]